MLKKPSLVLLLILLSSKCFATHTRGGELRYEFNGTNYTIYASAEFECGGVVPASNVTVTFTSGCGSPFMVIIPMTSLDTITESYCPYVTTSCGGGYSGFLRATYIGTANLSPCPNWEMSFFVNALTNTIDNINLPGSQDLYMTATLDNSIAENNAPKPSNFGTYILGCNTFNTIPFQITDIDGDSIVYELKHAESNGGNPMNYTTGYSATTQMGTYTSIDNNLQTISIAATLQSENYIYTEMKDYRNGVLVGSHTKSWTTNARPTGNPLVPQPLPGQNFSYPACPGTTNNINLNFIDSSVIDTLFFDFYPPTIPGLTITTSGTNTTGTGIATISWTLANNYGCQCRSIFLYTGKSKRSSMSQPGLCILLCARQCYTMYD